MSLRFDAELEKYGPGSAMSPPGLLEAQDYCRRLAGSHYENFTVASWLLPPRLRQPFCNVYAYCRWADDLADETGDSFRSLELLSWWERQLDDCYRGRARHPVFVALINTIEEYDLPPEPFRDLLSAFRQDQRKRRYETFAELLDYCRRSANPVGRLVLRLGRFDNAANAAWSDSICTGLQLANFWQDVRRDYEQDRIYLPRETQRRFGYGEDMFEDRTASDAFRQMLAFEVDRAESYLEAGRPLLEQTPPSLRVDIDLFLRGGLAILDAIRRQQFDVWKRRPSVGKLAKIRLLWSAWKAQRGTPA
ncbi:squalene synthase HpnC [Lignipirellula cremea]|uniref:All-trans-phytoene synthase n=1 Tax=Lignipirellula cremea TaxID=2528010 RepID=A0A518DN73_9BACT|nr:squalene synthase HpnC [Lignipirellula cremea]QDU93271.1 All-trans-phytoene synthase [Lignipirellula cremea]